MASSLELSVGITSSLLVIWVAANRAELAWVCDVPDLYGIACLNLRHKRAAGELEFGSVCRSVGADYSWLDCFARFLMEAFG